MWTGIVIGLIVGMWIAQCLSWLAKGLATIILHRQWNEVMAARLQVAEKIRQLGLDRDEEQGDEGTVGKVN
jgi:hypothetical protein